ncbi:MAG: site-2 protease family protein [Thermoproteota archaeon]
MSLKIGSLLGIPVKIHYTLILAFLLISWSLAESYMPAEYPELPVTQYWIIGVIGAIGLFVSVLVHELSHSYVAQKNGLPVRRIMLFIFGGVSETEGEAEDPGLEFKMAIVGPASSILIGIVTGVIWYALISLQSHPVVLAPLEYWSYINLLLGGFNLLPAFPLDGGRVLRATLWKWKYDFMEATKIATKVGIGFSYLFMLGGFAVIFLGSLTTGLWFVFIGWFLKNGAESNLRRTKISNALSGVEVRDIMTREVRTVEPDLSVQDLVEKYFARYKHGGYPVTKGSEVLGLVTVEDVRSVPQEKRRDTTIGEVMTPCEELVCLKPEEQALDAFMKISQKNIGRLPVLEQDKLAGIVTRSDILHSIKIRTEINT